MADESLFKAAVEYVSAGKFDASTEDKLKLYAYFKQATVGPCNTPRPGFFDFVGKSKWDAWNNLGNMSASEAMQRYIEIVERLAPGWKSQIAQADTESATSDEPRKKSGGSIFGGPVFSMMAPEEDAMSKPEPSNICEFAAAGNKLKVEELLNAGTDVNWKDDEGRTALHMAADSNNTELVEYLLEKGADIDAKDGEGQTALHYACICDYPELAQLLVRRGASRTITDDNSETPLDVASAELRKILEAM